MRRRRIRGKARYWFFLAVVCFCVYSAVVCFFVYSQLHVVSNHKQQQQHTISNLTLDSSDNVRKVKGKPNILLFSLDQWRYDWDGFHASPTGPIPIELPFFASMSSKGTRFTQAYVPSPIGGPVRACFASGKEFDEIGLLRDDAGKISTNTTNTFYKLMRDSAGYHTMTCGKNVLFKVDMDFPYFHGLNYSNPDGWIGLGFSDAISTADKNEVVREEPLDSYREYLEETLVSLPDGAKVAAIDAYRDCVKGEIAPGSSNCESTSFLLEHYPDTFVQRNAITLLDRKPHEKPWFLEINFLGPHPPFLATKEMAERVAKRQWPPPYDNKNYNAVCPQQEMNWEGGEFGPQRNGRCNYGAQIEYIDSLMDKTIRHLDSVNELDNTLVCITGDHGEMLGDHGQFAKSKPWQSAISVPLLCFGIGVQKGYIHTDPVTTLDLPGTFLDYAGYGSAPHPMTTRSLRPLLQNAWVDNVGTKSKQHNEITHNRSKHNFSSVREYVSSGYGNWRAVIKLTSRGKREDMSTYKLICCIGPCPGAPKTASPVSAQGWTVLLYDTIADPFDMVPLENELQDIVKEMLLLLPDEWCVGNAEVACQRMGLDCNLF